MEAHLVISHREEAPLAVDSEEAEAASADLAEEASAAVGPAEAGKKNEAVFLNSLIFLEFETQTCPEQLFPLYTTTFISLVINGYHNVMVINHIGQEVGR